MQLKWRMASDNSVAAVGVMIDDIQVAVAVCNGNAPTPTSVVSRHLHAGVPFDIGMPLGSANTSGVECRRGTGANRNNHQLIVTFAGPVTVGGVAVTSGDSLATATQSVAGNVVTVNLSAVADAQVLAVALSNVSSGGNLGSINIPVGILLGDVNASRSIKSEDAMITRSRAGWALDAKTFVSDVNEDGFINTGDTTIVRARSGNMLPESQK